MIKSSVSLLAVELLLQATNNNPALSSAQSGEQFPGSKIVISIVQAGSLSSLIVRITSPPPALPPCKLKLVGTP